MNEAIERVFELLCETCRRFYYPHCNNNPECDELVAARAELEQLQAELLDYKSRYAIVSERDEGLQKAALNYAAECATLKGALVTLAIDITKTSKANYGIVKYGKDAEDDNEQVLAVMTYAIAHPTEEGK